MKTRITDLFGIELPVIEGGMAWCSGWRLAAAVSMKGGLGVIGAGSMKPDILAENIDKCRDALGNRPFGVNIPLFNPYVKELIDVIVSKKVGIVITSGGNPSLYTSLFKQQGMIVAHVVASLKFALKAEDAGVDAVIAEGFEAGGHNGKDELTTMVLIPELVGKLSVPVVAAGGIASGGAWAAAMALGAEGVQIGTLFALSKESSAHDAYKEYCVGLGDTSTMLALKKVSPTRLVRNAFFKQVASMEDSGATKEQLQEFVGRGRNRKGTFEGDTDDEVSIGQCVCMIDSIESISDIIDRLVREYHVSIDRLHGIR